MYPCHCGLLPGEGFPPENQPWQWRSSSWHKCDQSKPWPFQTQQSSVSQVKKAQVSSKTSRPAVLIAMTGVAQSCTAWLKHTEATRNHLLGFTRLAEALGVPFDGTLAFLLQAKSRSVQWGGFGGFTKSQWGRQPLVITGLEDVFHWDRNWEGLLLGRSSGVTCRWSEMFVPLYQACNWSNDPVISHYPY